MKGVFRTRIITLVLAFVVFSLVADAQTADDLWKLYNDGKYQEVIAKAPRQSSDSELNLVLGRALADVQQCAEAMPYLQKANVRDEQRLWVKAWALNYLGRCSYQLGHKTQAKTWLDEAIQLNATVNATNAAKALSREYGFILTDYFKGGTNRETKHFSFHFPQKTLVKNIDDFR